MPSGVVTVTSVSVTVTALATLRQHHGNACSQHDAELLTCHQTESFVLLSVLFEMILITHAPPPRRLIARQNRTRIALLYRSVGALRVTPH